MNKKSLTVYLFLFFTAVMMLVGCSKRKKVLEEQDITDAVRRHVESYYASCGVEEWMIILDARQEIEENEIENVWVSAIASSEFLHLELEYYVTFVYYDDVWLMENIEVADHNYSILKSDITEENARQYINQNEFGGDYYEIELIDHNLDLEAGRDYFRFEGTRYDDYWGEQRDIIEVRFTFGIYSGWSYSKTKYKGEHITDLSPWDSGISVVPEFG